MNQKAIILAGADYNLVTAKLGEIKSDFLEGTNKIWDVFALNGQKQIRLSTSLRGGFLEKQFVLCITDWQSCRETLRAVLMDAMNNLRLFCLQSIYSLVCLTAPSENPVYSKISADAYVTFMREFLLRFSSAKYMYQDTYNNTTTIIANLCGASVSSDQMYKFIRLCYPIGSNDIHSAYTTSSVLTLLLRNPDVAFDSDGKALVGDALLRNIVNKMAKYYRSTSRPDANMDRKTPESDPLFLIWLLVALGGRWDRQYIPMMETPCVNSDSFPSDVTGPSRLVYRCLMNMLSRQSLLNQINSLGTERLNYIFNDFDESICRVYTSPSSVGFCSQLPDFFNSLIKMHKRVSPTPLPVVKKPVTRTVKKTTTTKGV